MPTGQRRRLRQDEGEESTRRRPSAGRRDPVRAHRGSCGRDRVRAHRRSCGRDPVRAHPEHQREQDLKKRSDHQSSCERAQVRGVGVGVGVGVVGSAETTSQRRPRARAVGDDEDKGRQMHACTLGKRRARAGLRGRPRQNGLPKGYQKDDVRARTGLPEPVPRYACIPSKRMLIFHLCLLPCDHAPCLYPAFPVVFITPASSSGSLVPPTSGCRRLLALRGGALL